jgi:hypothetical protein
MYYIIVFIIMVLGCTLIDGLVSGPYKFMELLIKFVMFGIKLLGGLIGILLFILWVFFGYSFLLAK